MLRALVLATGLALAVAACQLIGSTPPQGYRCEDNGSCEGALLCCSDGFCRSTCEADAGSKCVNGALCSSNASAPCTNGRLACLDGGGSTCMDAELAPAGTVCSGNQVCRSGTCGACVSGADCATNASACHVGSLSCSASAPTCGDTATARAPGDACGLNKVCTDAGACIACTANAACTNNPNVCDDGITDCSAGTPQCRDSTHKAPGFVCSLGFVCDGDGGCKPCTGGGPCTSNPDPCKDGTLSCMSGTSQCIDGSQKPLGSPCGGGKTCDATGACK